ncbi:Glutathione-dependent formaldehyde-activating enzyme [Aliiroseovarius crassostreae]|nr:Glutathione-dependent formaldehyde-activating enzyme [Aliiroseovarius crassostreae]
MAFALPEGRIASPSTNLAQAQQKHYFCKICGIYTHHQRRFNPNEYGVNVACLDGVSPFDFPELVVHDGVNHPSDGASGIAGILRYSKS